MSNNNRNLYRVVPLLSLLFWLVFSPIRVLADPNLDFYAKNDILFYYPNGCGGGSSNQSGQSSLDGYTLPAESGKTGDEDPIDSSGRLTTTGETVTFHELASKVPQEYRDYAINMRWNWTSWYWSGNNTGLDQKQFEWMKAKPRLILVTNKRNGKSIIAAALESGPAPWTGAKGEKGGASANGWTDPQKGTPTIYTGRVSGLTPPAIKALDAKQGMSDGSGDILTYSWAQDQNAKPGPATASSATSASSTPASASGGYVGGPFSTTGPVTFENNDTLKNMFQILIDNGFNNVQASAIMGNFQAESNFQSNLQKGKMYGLSQWTGGRLAKLQAFATNKKADVSDIPTQIAFLASEYKDTNNTYKSSLDTRGFSTATDVRKAATDWMEVYEEILQSKWPDSVSLATQRMNSAEKIYGWYKDLQGGNSSTVNNCNSNPSITDGTIANKIVATALSYARKTPVQNGQNQASDAEPAYIDALNKYNPGANPADCGIYVATVMRATGDKNYPGAGTSLQIDYVKSHPELYKVITNFKMSDLQPGDVMIAVGGSVHHTQIFVGSMGGNYPAVDASQDERVPGVKTHVDSRLVGVSYGLIARRLK